MHAMNGNSMEVEPERLSLSYEKYVVGSSYSKYMVISKVKRNIFL